jgi:hypothetical protein
MRLQFPQRVVALFVLTGAIVATMATCSWSAPPKVDRELSAQEIAKIEAALPTEAPAQPLKPRKVLVCTLARGFVHSSIPVGAKAFELMGKKLGTWETVISHDPEMFMPEKLNQFDAVIMESTTGELFGVQDKAHNEELRKSFLEFVKSGHGLVGVHAATDCSYHWPEYGEMIGGYFNGHPWHSVSYKIDDPNSPLTAMFPKDGSFVVNDETYTFKKEPYSREKLHILASIDYSKMSEADKKKENRPYDHDYALAWIHEFGKGRVFYAAHGHGEAMYVNPTMLKFYLAGIQYALGDLKADAMPSGTAGSK